MDQRLHLDVFFFILIFVTVTDVSTIILIIIIAMFTLNMIKVMFLDLLCEDLVGDLGEEDEEELENVPGQTNAKCWN